MIPFAILLRPLHSPSRATWLVWVHAWQASEALAQVASREVRVLGVAPITSPYRGV